MPVALPVRIVTSAADRHWSPTDHELRPTPDGGHCRDRRCPARRGPCDLDRTGVLRAPPALQIDGRGWWVYVEDMPADGLDDDCPSRYVRPRHVALIEED